MKKTKPQLELPLQPRLRVIQGLGEKRRPENLKSREAVARLLIEAGADMILRKISPERAEHVEEKVEEVLSLFDRVDQDPALWIVLETRLGELERLMTETRAVADARSWRQAN